MAINLSKGQRIDLTKGRPSLNKILVGLGWDTNRYDGEEDFDLDASCFLLNSNEKVRNDNDFIFYGNLEHSSGAVKHYGDNRDGNGDGDDEKIEITLNKIPFDVDYIDITTTIYDAERRLQNFGMVSNAYIRLVDMDTNEELMRFDLSEDYSVETSLVFARIYRHNNEWKFNAVGSGYTCGLVDLCTKYGIDAQGE